MVSVISVLYKATKRIVVRPGNAARERRELGEVQAVILPAKVPHSDAHEQDHPQRIEREPFPATPDQENTDCQKRSEFTIVARANISAERTSCFFSAKRTPADHVSRSRAPNCPFSSVSAKAGRRILPAYRSEELRG